MSLGVSENIKRQTRLTLRLKCSYSGNWLVFPISDLSKPVADALGSFAGSIQLSDVCEVSLDVAEVLARRTVGRVCLGLQELPVEIAKAFSTFSGEALVLDQLESLSEEAAQFLAKMPSRDLYLNALTELSTEIAAILVSRGGFLSLDGLTDFPDLIIEQFKAFKGRLDVFGLPAKKLKQVRKLLGQITINAGASDRPLGDALATLRNTIGMSFKLIPAGEFIMMGSRELEAGSPESEAGRDADEAQRAVKIPSAFWIGVYEVTQSQYKSVMGSNPSHFKGANKPVDSVSWSDAVAFCVRLSSLPAEVAAGRVYRLPTEAEWEYACRAGTTTAYSFGDDAQDLGKYAWFGDNSGSTTHAGGKKLPNGWGLYDMHGNVWEWCSDVDDDVGSSRVRRGGSWYNDAAFCRTADRRTGDPPHRTYNYGFRLALSSPSGKSPEAAQDK